MRRQHTIAITSLALTIGATALVAGSVRPGTIPGTFIGPTTFETPYVNPTAPGWEVTSLLTVGDSAEETYFPMVGIPDGLGAAAGKINERGDFVADKAFMTIFMNHELGATAGAIRAHGQTGAFVSQWSVHLNSLQVKFGEDLMREVWLWDSLNQQYFVGNALTAAQFARFCSADLPPAGAFFNPATGKGFDGRIFMDGEENGNEGRAFAHIVTGADKGRSYQLAGLGHLSFENVVAHPDAGDTTLVVGLDDSTPGQVYLYVGSKRGTGTPIERAGLTGGSLYGIRVTNGGAAYANAAAPFEDKGALNGTFTLVNVSDVAQATGASLQTTSRSRGITEFARPEDGSWDSKSPNVFYFVTTGASINGASQTSRLYKLTLDSVTSPSGGTIALVVDSASLVGSDGQAARTFDNITVDGDGFVVAQEDPGNSSYIAKTWRINPAAPLSAVQILESDRSRFLNGAPNFLTQDEENSGVIEVTDIVSNANWFQKGRRYYLGVTQAHYGLPVPLVEGGQLYLIASPKK